MDKERTNKETTTRFQSYRAQQFYILVTFTKATKFLFITHSPTVNTNFKQFANRFS